MARKTEKNKKKNQAKDNKLEKKNEKFGIRECRVIIHRMNADTNVAFRQALFRMHGIKELCVRLIRLENAGNTHNGLSTIGLPTKQIGTNPVHQRRIPTMQDLHSELIMKFNSLEPVNQRNLPDPKPQPVPQWKQIYQEFQAKRLAKNNNS